MVNKQKLLDAVMRREKTRIIRRVFKYGAFALVFGSLLVFAEFKNFDRVKFSHELNGVVESVSASDTVKTDTTFVVKLENGKSIKIIKLNDESFQKGESVKILREELESGRMQYSFALLEASPK